MNAVPLANKAPVVHVPTTVLPTETMKLTPVDGGGDCWSSSRSLVPPGEQANRFAPCPVVGSAAAVALTHMAKLNVVGNTIPASDVDGDTSD